MLPQILLIGATGRTGLLVLDEALKRGHFVTAIIRKPNNELPQHENFNTVIGDPCKDSDVKSALQSTKPDIPIVIISTLGQTRTSGNPWAATTSPPRFINDAMEAILAASESFTDAGRIQKLVVMSMFGAGDSYANNNCMMQWIFRSSNMAQTLEDHNLVDETVKAGSLPFVLVRPAMLNTKDAAPVKVHGNTGKSAGFMPSVSMKTVTGFLLDAAVDTKYDGHTPMITN